MRVKKYGFDAVASASAKQGYPPPISTDTPHEYTPQAGDVVVIQSTSTSKDGHMAMFSGKQWISDFEQKDFWPGKDCLKEKPSYVIYRHKNK